MSEKTVQIPARGEYTEEARQRRVDFLRTITGATLENIAPTHTKASLLRTNLEHFIGVVEVPVGVAGPLLLHGATGSRQVYAPLATTEGALVASVNRGAAAITRAGGVQVKVMGQRMVRAPLFVLGSLAEALVLHQWIETHHAEIERRQP